MTVHLDEKRLEALLEGKLSSAEEADLARHLAGEECPACEEFLGNLDEGVEAQLFRILSRSASAGDLPTGANRKILESITPKRPVPRAVLIPAVGFTVVALLVLAVVFWLPAGDGVRVKGDGEKVVGIELSLGLVEPAKAGTVEVRRVASGAEVSQDNLVVFRVTTDAPCCLYLVRVGPDGLEVLVPDYFDEPVRHRGGAYLPTTAGNPVAYSLAGNAGTQHFAAVCSQKPLASLKDLQPLAESLWRAGEPVDMVSYSVVTLRVSGEGKAE